MQRREARGVLETADPMKRDSFAGSWERPLLGMRWPEQSQSNQGGRHAEKSDGSEWESFLTRWLCISLVREAVDINWDGICQSDDNKSSKTLSSRAHTYTHTVVQNSDEKFSHLTEIIGVEWSG